MFESAYKIDQIYTKCLAQGSYFIESNGEAVVVDPLRETDPYIQRAVERGVKIKYIFETHFHADFVSGHLSLANKTGATIIYGPGAKTNYEIYNAKDGEIFKFGNFAIKAIHTPGHTPESTCYLLHNEHHKPTAIFSGDTLFIGDVGRPDLAQASTGLTSADLAGWLYDSLRDKIMPLPDDIILYPAHGAGSSCGKNMSKETFDTLGSQKESNYALRKDLSKEDFITELLDGLTEPPEYFRLNVAINKNGYEDIDVVMARGLKALSAENFSKLASQEDVLILDTRDKYIFAKAFIPGSICIGIDGSFAPWAGEIIPNMNQKLIIVSDQGREEEVVRRLARVGFDQCLGYLDGGFESWINAEYQIQNYPIISIEDFKNMDTSNFSVIDFRKPTEYYAGHLTIANNIPLSEIHQSINNLDKSKSYIIHCQSGYRSTIASSLLSKKGINFINLIANFNDFEKAGLSVITS